MVGDDKDKVFECDIVSPDGSKHHGFKINVSLRGRMVWMKFGTNPNSYTYPICSFSRVRRMNDSEKFTVIILSNI